MSNNLMGNSALPNYVKLTATGILGTTYVAALIVATHEYLAFGPATQIPTVISFILGTGVSMALGILGIHQGAALAESVPPSMQATPATQGGTPNASTPTA